MSIDREIIILQDLLKEKTGKPPLERYTECNTEGPPLAKNENPDSDTTVI